MSRPAAPLAGNKWCRCGEVGPGCREEAEDSSEVCHLLLGHRPGSRASSPSTQPSPFGWFSRGGGGVAARGTGICQALVTRSWDWGQRFHDSWWLAACRPRTALRARCSDLPLHPVCPAEMSSAKAICDEGTNTPGCGTPRDEGKGGGSLEQRGTLWPESQEMERLPGLVWPWASHLPAWVLLPHVHNEGLSLDSPAGPAAGTRPLLGEGASPKNPRSLQAGRVLGDTTPPPLPTFTEDCQQSLGARQRRVSPQNYILGGLFSVPRGPPTMPPGVCDQESPLGPNLSRFRERPASSSENLTLASKSYPIPTPISVRLFESPALRPIW